MLSVFEEIRLLNAGRDPFNLRFVEPPKIPKKEVKGGGVEKVPGNKAERGKGNRATVNKNRGTTASKGGNV